ncbi:mitogen-activated protein kinase kinase kinase 7 isoform X7 [Aplysia californica]|uniref:Mitogen-activated protein kinase kinase kinase 7 isoform X7 n=1 Tax=Aplysia californica TaxID=6500 RepID=A0ABM1W312_APLCA|nr:mitogen-activated protein kinase kinase kinase 7 isoform X7 [Aplysia californica]
MDPTQSFIEEIDYQELKFIEVVGKGAFGVVSRAQWRGKDVAVKRIETESEKKAFMQELKQLSRVSHPNIVRLYGACREHPVCLVMEYAEGGSLYNVLHGSGQQPLYKAAHAMSWCLQCARGVEYLHNMKPKALVHRDLKPPNLLLITRGTVLKICDFGTACDIQTHMTNNKGSAAWMAPEVFEGSNYSEKCDVFSWGIIFWEVLTRRKPFDEIGGPAFRIMWAVHNGRRPPPIQNLPKPLEILMTRCWSGNPSERPSMAEVARIMSCMYQFFCGGDEPLVITRTSEMDDDDYSMESAAPYSVTPHGLGMASSGAMTAESRASTISDTLRYNHNDMRPAAPHTPVVVEEDKKPRGQMSAPPSLAASRESLHDPRSSRSATPVDTGKRLSADNTKLDELDLSVQQAAHHAQLRGRRGIGHRRIGSDEYARLSSLSSPLSINTGTSPGSSSGLPPVHHSNTYPSQLVQLSHGDMGGPSAGGHQVFRGPGDGLAMSPPSRSVSYQPPGREPIVVSPRSFSLSSERQLPAMARQGHEAAYASVEHAYYNNEAYFSLEPHLQPIPPCLSNPESMQIFEEHCNLAEEYLRIQAEIAVLTQRKHEMNKEREQHQERHLKSKHLEEYTKLTAENESLKSVYKELRAQVEKYKHQAGTKRIG